MRTPVMSNTMAKTFFNFTLSILAPMATPIGVDSVVRGVMQRNPMRLRSPNVPAGASVGVVPNEVVPRNGARAMLI